jgi:hypothetical protein
MAERLNFRLIDFRFLNSPEQRWHRQPGPLKAPVNADNRRYRSLDFRFEEFLRTRRAHVGPGDKGYPGIDIG